MHLGMVYETEPPAFIVAVAPQLLPLRPSCWILNHTALITNVSTCQYERENSGNLLSPRHPVVAASVRTLGHVGDGRTDMCVRP
jgi:hypothetical protein